MIGPDTRVRRRVAAAIVGAGYVAAAVATATAARRFMREGRAPCVIVYVMRVDENGVEDLAAHRADPRTAALPVVLVSVGASGREEEPPPSMLAALLGILRRYCDGGTPAGETAPPVRH